MWILEFSLTSILDYIQSIVDTFNAREHIRFISRQDTTHVSFFYSKKDTTHVVRHQTQTMKTSRTCKNNSESYLQVCLVVREQYKNFYNSEEFHKLQPDVTIDVGPLLISAPYLNMITEEVSF